LNEVVKNETRHLDRFVQRGKGEKVPHQWENGGRTLEELVYVLGGGEGGIGRDQPVGQPKKNKILSELTVATPLK